MHGSLTSEQLATGTKPAIAAYTVRYLTRWPDENLACTQDDDVAKAQLVVSATTRRRLNL